MRVTHRGVTPGVAGSGFQWDGGTRPMSPTGYLIHKANLSRLGDVADYIYISSAPKGG